MCAVLVVAWFVVVGQFSLGSSTATSAPPSPATLEQRFWSMFGKTPNLKTSVSDLFTVASQKFEPVMKKIETFPERVEAVADYLRGCPSYQKNFVDFLQLSVDKWLQRKEKTMPKQKGGHTVTISGYGIVTGRVVEAGCVCFQGLPYAKQPVGPLRWKPPQPLDEPKGSLPHIPATRYGPAPFQFKSKPGLVEETVMKTEKQSEECLNLNVFMPYGAMAASKPYPVIVFIHGGKFTTGSARMPLYNPIDLVADGLKGEVIYVSFDYRLGIFGYAAGSALFKDSLDPVGNYGLLDQIAAIRWVKKHISAFNGDPNNITVMGHSAGSMSASFLQLIDQEAELKLGVAKWVLLSGTALSWHQRRAEGEFENKVWEEVAKKVGCDPSDVAAMRRVDPKLLNQACKDLKLDLVFGPTIDGRLFGDPAWVMLEKHRHKIGPTILTVVRDEASIFVGPLVKSWDDFNRIINELYPPELAKRVINEYTATHDNCFSAANSAFSDAMFVCPAERYFKALPNAYLTKLAHPMILVSVLQILADGRHLGTFHGSDIILLYNFNPLITGPCYGQMIGLRESLLRFLKTASPLAVDPSEDTVAANSMWAPKEECDGPCRRVWTPFGHLPSISPNFNSGVKV